MKRVPHLWSRCLVVTLFATWLFLDDPGENYSILQFDLDKHPARMRPISENLIVTYSDPLEGFVTEAGSRSCTTA